MRLLVATLLRRWPWHVAAGCAVAGLGLAVSALLSWAGLISDLAINDRYTKAPQCSAAEAAMATTAVEHCKTDLTASVGYSERGGGADYPLSLEFGDGSTMIAPLQSQSDFDAFDQSPPVVATVWENEVTTVRISAVAYQTRDNPGTRIPFDIGRALVLTLLSLGAISLIAASIRAVQAQKRLRSSTAGIAQVFTTPPREAVYPPGYGRPPETWGEQPAQPGFGGDLQPGQTWQQKLNRDHDVK